jgi:hypothetical protein
MPAPTFDRRAICVSGNPQLAALISCYFNKKDSYFALLDPPAIWKSHPDTDLFDKITESTVIPRTNFMAELKPNFFILAGLKEKEEELLLERMPRQRTILIRNEADVDAKLSNATKFNAELRCRRKEFLLGLYQAKLGNLKLVYDNSAPALQEKNEEFNNIVYLEKDDDVASVIGVNYALACNSSVKFLTVSEAEFRDIEKDQWSLARSSFSENAFINLKNKIRKLVDPISANGFEFATFITRGIPYSILFSDHLPTCHLLRRPDLWQQIGIAILSEWKRNPRFGSAVVFSPDVFALKEVDGTIDEDSPLPLENTETLDVAHNLKTHKFIVKVLRNKKASFKNFDLYASVYPYDIFHICSHGGEIDGWEVRETFKDKHGKLHLLQSEEAVGYDLPDKFAPDTKIETFVFQSFKKLDGVDWNDKNGLKRIPGYVMTDYIANRHNDSYIISRQKRSVPIVDTSNAIICNDSPHFGMFSFLAAQSNPVIFNNSCGSWNRLGLHFIHAGARVYISTLWSVPNVGATEVAKRFYDQVFDKPLLFNLHKARAALDGHEKNIYIFFGCHFSTLRSPQKKQWIRLRRLILKWALTWLIKAPEYKEEGLRDKTRDMAKFLFRRVIS